MDKLRILKELGNLTAGDALNAEEVRLFLLLLAHSRDTGNGEIDCRAVKEALGEGFTRVRVKRACRRLSRHNLIEIISLRPAADVDDDFTLIYRIYPVGEHQK